MSLLSPSAIQTQSPEIGALRAQMAEAKNNQLEMMQLQLEQNKDNLQMQTRNNIANSEIQMLSQLVATAKDVAQAIAKNS